MRMKSVLAFTALSAATFLAGVAYAADAKPATKAAAATAKAQPQAKTEAAAPAQTEQQAAEPAEAAKTEHKKHAHHKHHRHHKKHHHHRHHHHKHHKGFHDHFHGYEVIEEIPDWNFLAGGSLGYASQKENFITRYVSSALNPPGVGVAPGALISPFQYRDTSSKITDAGVMMSLLAGWQYHYKRWLFGAEANVDFQSFERDRQFVHLDDFTGVIVNGAVVQGNPLVGTLLYDRGDIYAITGRAGYFVTPFFMPYVRLGAQMSRDEVNYQVNVNGSLVAPFSPVPGVVPGVAFDFSSRKKDVYGFVAGVGAEFPTYIGASTIRFEYNFTKTESVIIEDNFLPVVGNHKFRYPETHIGKIAWVWNFM
ncbi:MAG: hypothetical protein JSR17_07860 [Proteobacteria bacterium]|nr:hypothetical protein [Pseudomonadota bacterium]